MMKNAALRFVHFGVVPALVLVVVDTLFRLGAYSDVGTAQNLVIVALAFGLAAACLGPLAKRALMQGESLLKIKD